MHSLLQLGEIDLAMGDGVADDVVGPEQVNASSPRSNLTDDDPNLASLKVPYDLCSIPPLDLPSYQSHLVVLRQLSVQQINLRSVLAEDHARTRPLTNKDLGLS